MIIIGARGLCHEIYHRLRARETNDIFLFIIYVYLYARESTTKTLYRPSPRHIKFILGTNRTKRKPE